RAKCGVHAVCAWITVIDDDRFAERPGDGEARILVRRQPQPAPAPLGEEDLSWLGGSGERACCNELVSACRHPVDRGLVDLTFCIDRVAVRSGGVGESK